LNSCMERSKGLGMCHRSKSCTERANSPFHEIEGTKQRIKKKLRLSHRRPCLHVNLLRLLLMSILNCLALTVDAKTYHVNLHIFSTLSRIPVVMLPFVHSFTPSPVFHRIAQDNQRYKFHDPILGMRGPPGNDYFRQFETEGQGAADDSSGQDKEENSSAEYQTSDYFRQMETQGQATAGPEDRKDSNKWNISPPKFNITTPSVSLPDMPSLPNFFNDEKKEVDENERAMRAPLNLFGALPQLEFEFNTQLNPLTKKDAPGGETKNAQPFLLDALTSSVNQVTGKGKYQFGDLTRYIDTNAKLYVRNMQKDVRKMQSDSEDLSQRLDQRMEQKIQQIDLSRVEMQQNVQSVTKTLIKKVASDEYDLSEITFLCKVLFALGVDFSAVTGLLPAGILLEVFGVGIACGIGERFFSAVIKELDRRLYSNEEETDGNVIDKDTDLVASNTALLSIKQEETSLEAYIPGDLTKQAMQEYTGSESYQVGHISEKMANSDEVEDPIDVISELEECLAMERELAQKLSYIRSR